MSGGWNTIESDAGVFTYLIDNLGVKDVQFEELISLEPEALAELHPLYGVIFLFKYPTDKPYTSADKPLDGTFDHEAAEELFFAAQTIQNACGTQALLSVILNKTGDSDGDAAAAAAAAEDDTIDIGEPLREFRAFAMCVPPALRGEVLSNSELIRTVHNSFARSSPFVDETRRGPDDDDADAFHFVAYTALRGTLYELDGLQPAPIRHGAAGTCGPADFPARVVDVLQRRIARYDAGEIRFNLLAVTRDGRLRARTLGDEQMLAREQRKRRDWQFENALRRHNFVGFAGDVLRGVVAMKLGAGEGAYERWVGDATASMRKRIDERRSRKEGAGAGAEQEEDVDMQG